MKRKFLFWLALSLVLTSLPASGWAQKTRRKSTRKATKVKTATQLPDNAVNAPPAVMADPEVKPRPTPARAANPAATTALLESLPQSDAVMFVELRRVLDEVLPLLSESNPALATQVNSQLEKFKQQTSLDPRSFERMAVSFHFTPTNGGFTAKPLVLVNGSFNAGALIAAGRFAANGKYQQEEYKGKQIYRFPLGDVVNLPLVSGNINELAVFDLNENTLALGDVSVLKEALDAGQDGARVSKDLVTLATRNPNALVGFSGNVPTGAATSFGLDTENDEIGKTVAAIRQAAGSLSLNDKGAHLLVAARTGKESEAKNLTDTINALRQFAGFFIGNLKPEQQKLAENALETLKVAQTGNETQVSLDIRRSDFPALLQLIK